MGSRQTYHKGQRAEGLARWYLRLKGYRIVAQNWRSPVGEVDIIARRGKTLAFIEVKYRQTRTQALEAITPRQRQRIYQAAPLFLQQQSRYDGFTLRFDALAMMPWRWPYHLINAWGQNTP